MFPGLSSHAYDLELQLIRCEAKLDVQILEHEITTLTRSQQASGEMSTSSHWNHAVRLCSPDMEPINRSKLFLQLVGGCPDQSTAITETRLTIPSNGCFESDFLPTFRIRAHAPVSQV